VRQVRRHAEGNNIILLVVLLEFKQVVALVAVNNEQTYCANSTPLCIGVKVL
jgi:hypothetical protein